MESRWKLSQRTGPSKGCFVDENGVPNPHLPMWLSLPLDSKLPMIEANKGPITLSTTHLGEKIQKCYPNQKDFDLGDPYNLVVSNDYKALHDPHLKNFLNSPRIKRILVKEGFITESGQVICTLKEFNEYRQYLRRLQLLRIQQQRVEKQACETRKGKSSSTDKLLEGVDLRKFEVQRRINQQKHDELERKNKIIRIHKKKQEMIIRQKKQLKAEIDIRRKFDKERRNQLLHRKCMMEEQRRTATLQNFHKQDLELKHRLKEIRRKWEEQRQKLLTEKWDWQYESQLARQHEEKKIRLALEEERKKHIAYREKILERHRKRHYATFVQIRDTLQQEKQNKEETYQTNLLERLKYVRGRKDRKGREKKTHRDLRSTWSITKTLDTPKLFEGCIEPEICEESFNDVESAVSRSLSALGLNSFHGATFNEELVAELAEKEEQKSRTSFSDLKKTKGEPSRRDIENYERELHRQAAYIVNSTLAIVSKIIFPAYVQYHQEIMNDQDNYPYMRPVTPILKDIRFGEAESFLISDDELDSTTTEEDIIQTVENESLDSIHPPGKLGRSGVRFSIVTETIPTEFHPRLVTMDLDEQEGSDVDLDKALVSRDGEALDLVSLDDAQYDDDTEEMAGHLLCPKDSLTIAERRLSANTGLNAQYVKESLAKVLADLESGALSAEQVFKLASFASQCLTSLHEESETIDILPDGSLSEFADSVVTTVLERTWNNLANDKLPAEQLKELTVAFVTSVQTGDVGVLEKDWSSTSIKAQMIVEETLNKVISDSSVMTDADISDLAQRISFAVKGSKTSIQAERAVGHCLDRMGVKEPIKFTQRRSDTSLKAEEAVTFAIKDSARKLRQAGQQEWSDTVKAERVVYTTLNKILSEKPSSKKMSSTSLKAENAVRSTLDHQQANVLPKIRSDIQSMSEVQEADSLRSHDVQTLKSSQSEGFIQSTMRKISGLFKRPSKDKSEGTSFIAENVVKSALRKTIGGQTRGSDEDIFVQNTIEDVLTNIYRHGLSRTEVERVSACVLESDARQHASSLSLDRTDEVLRDSSTDINEVVVKHVLSKVINSIDSGNLSYVELKKISSLISVTQLDESSTEEETEIQPVIDGAPVDLNSELVTSGISAISLKNPHLVQGLHEPQERNSFRNLTRPELRTVQGIDKSSVNSLKKEFYSASLVGVDGKTVVKEDTAPSVSDESFKGSAMSIRTCSVERVAGLDSTASTTNNISTRSSKSHPVQKIRSNTSPLASHVYHSLPTMKSNRKESPLVLDERKHSKDKVSVH